MITRDNLEETPWAGLQLNEKQTEELIQDLINGLNRFPETSATWTCSGDTLVATGGSGLTARSRQSSSSAKSRDVSILKVRLLPRPH